MHAFRCVKSTAFDYFQTRRTRSGSNPRLFSEKACRGVRRDAPSQPSRAINQCDSNDTQVLPHVSARNPQTFKYSRFIQGDVKIEEKQGYFLTQAVRVFSQFCWIRLTFPRHQGATGLLFGDIVRHRTRTSPTDTEVDLDMAYPSKLNSLYCCGTRNSPSATLSLRTLSLSSIGAPLRRPSSQAYSKRNTNYREGQVRCTQVPHTSAHRLRSLAHRRPPRRRRLGPGT